ncbi:MAG TPA: hypothetical protein ENH50_10600 [Nitrospirae bacterium]|nr:hypothetical protein [Nitrospirota bacterium]
MEMQERRRTQREKVSIEIQFAVTEFERGTATRLVTKGRIVDMCPGGFGLETEHPPQKGYVITVINDGREGTPPYGWVKWTEQKDGVFRAGLGYSFRDSGPGSDLQFPDIQRGSC